MKGYQYKWPRFYAPSGIKKKRFSFFNGTSIFVGYLMQKLSLYSSSSTIGGSKEVQKGICRKVNTIMQLKIELANYTVTVQHISHYNIGSPPRRMFEWIYLYVDRMWSWMFVYLWLFKQAENVDTNCCYIKTHTLLTRQYKVKRTDFFKWDRERVNLNNFERENPLKRISVKYW